jgi:hypothetical protein
MTEPLPTTPPQSQPKPDAAAVAAAPRKTSRLETFRAPNPSPWLIKALGPVNRVLCLGGIPVLRDVPGLRRLPVVRGLTDIRRIDLPDADIARLKSSVRPETAAFLTPNHPEFFTDWMLDKAVLDRVAPMAACWATHTVVNGLGGLAQAFWLKTNLIAQIPGAAGAEGRAHSVHWAVKGHGVLLHPEGQVGWHGDWVGPLFPGAVEMAAEAGRELGVLGGQRAAYVVPLVWKLKFQRDAGAGLAAELDYVEQRLGLPQAARGTPAAQRVHALYSALLARDEAVWNGTASDCSYGERQRKLLGVLSEALAHRLTLHSPELGDDLPADRQDPSQLLRAADRWLRNADPKHSYRDDIRRLVRDTRRLLRFRPGIYPHAALTQEHVAECIKRLRNDYCEGTLRDTASRFVPRPVAPRTAYVRVPEPINISALLRGRPNLEQAETDAVVADLRARMQSSIDAINAEVEKLPPNRGGFIREANPFHEVGHQPGHQPGHEPAGAAATISSA